MRPRATSQSQRARRTLSQEAMKRSHRRCDLIRLATEDEPAAPPPQSAGAAEQPDQLAVTPPHS